MSPRAGRASRYKPSLTRWDLRPESMLIGKKKAVDGKMSDSLSASYRQWHDKLVQAVRMHLPADTPYTVVHVGDMIGLFSCILVKTSEATRLRDSALVTVKTGMGGRYGNKGAILSRVYSSPGECAIDTDRTQMCRLRY